MQDIFKKETELFNAELKHRIIIVPVDLRRNDASVFPSFLSLQISHGGRERDVSSESLLFIALTTGNVLVFSSGNIEL